MKIAWISGWAVPPAWMAQALQARWPQYTHHVFLPEKNTPATLLVDSTFDAYGGYSLGSLLWLDALSENACAKPVRLLAPFFSFCAEASLGGRTPRVRLLFLKRWLRRDPTSALHDFYTRTGLPQFPIPGTSSLADGLDLLDTLAISTPPPSNIRGFAGKNDPLLNPKSLRTHWPALTIVPHANHALPSLLQHMCDDPFCE